MFINIPAFLIALFVGLCYTYFNKPIVRIVTKYPTPYNADKITYLDDAGVCYKYSAEEIQCPTDMSKIIEFPIQQDTGENILRQSNDN